MIDLENAQWVCFAGDVCECTGDDYDCQCEVRLTGGMHAERCERCGAAMHLIDCDTNAVLRSNGAVPS